MTDISREAVEAVAGWIDRELECACDRETLIGHGYFATTRVLDEVPNLLVMLRAQADEIARLKQVKEDWHDIDRKSSARIEVLERALRELLEASEMNERDLELCEYETIMEDAQTRARELLS